MPRLAALLALAAVAVAGCGGEDEERVDGEGYSYAAPEDWNDVSEELSDARGLEFAGVRPDTIVAGETEDDFATNVNVVADPGLPDDLPSDVFAQANIEGLRNPARVNIPPEVADAIEALDVRELRRTGAVDLDGEEAVSWEYLSTPAGRDLRLRQIAVVLDGTGYTLTMTALPDRFEEGSDALDEVVESWTWD
jgi:hypothetical protein